MSVTTIQSIAPAIRVLNRLRIGRDLPLLPLAILVPFVLIAVFANVIAPYDPTEPIPGAKIFEPPFWAAGGSVHTLLGTDYQSRDVLSRLIFGARVSLIVGVVGTIVEFITLGRMWRMMMRVRLAPAISASFTNSRSRRLSTSPRITRA